MGVRPHIKPHIERLEARLDEVCDRGRPMCNISRKHTLCSAGQVPPERCQVVTARSRAALYHVFRLVQVVHGLKTQQEKVRTVLASVFAAKRARPAPAGLWTFT